MTVLQTERLGIDQIHRAADWIRAGRLVAFPTETVYGLGANALDASAIERIYIAKGRPSDNPLIVHVDGTEQVDLVANHVDSISRLLMDAFWPGPLTIVLPKREIICDRVSAGLPTVAVRMPDHPIANALIRTSQVPIAAPSANRSGRPSATTWQAALEDLDGKIEAVICGNHCHFGVESTVVQIKDDAVHVLRYGGVTVEMLSAIHPKVIHGIVDLSSVKEPLNSPGIRHKHYQPRACVFIASADQSTSLIASTPNDKHSDEKPKSAWIGVQSPVSPGDFDVVEILNSPEDYALRLFSFFREMDQQQIGWIFCEPVQEVGIGRALMDRLRRASHTSFPDSKAERLS